MENNPIFTDIQSLSSILNFSKIFMLFVGMLFIWLIAEVIDFLARSVAGYFPAKRFMISQANTLLSFIVYLGGAFVLFIGVINPSKEIIIAAAGSMAVAVGFALKDIASSVIAGMILLFDNPFKVGDRISFEDKYGEIISIGLRSVKIKTLDDNIVTIPNSRFINDSVASGNYGALDMMVVCDFHVDISNDIEKAKDIIREVIVTSRFAFLKKPVSFSINEIVMHNTVAIQIKAKAYVMDVNYEKAFQSDIVERVNSLFIEQGITRPASMGR